MGLLLPSSWLQVWKVKDKESGKVFACKRIRGQALKGQVGEDFKQEIRMLRALDHPSVLKVFEVFQAVSVDPHPHHGPSCHHLPAGQRQLTDPVKSP